MRNLTRFCLLSFLTFLSNSWAETTFGTVRPNSNQNGGDLGLGLMLGEPSGITGKYWFSQEDAVDGGFAYSFNNYTTLMADYLRHFKDILNSPMHGELSPYVGLGGILFIASNSTGPGGNLGSQHFFSGSGGNDVAFGARVPLGLEYLPRKAPFGLFVEVDPGIGLIPGTFGFIEAEVGGRFYF